MYTIKCRKCGAVSVAPTIYEAEKLHHTHPCPSAVRTAYTGAGDKVHLTDTAFWGNGSKRTLCGSAVWMTDYGTGKDAYNRATCERCRAIYRNQFEWVE